MTRDEKIAAAAMQLRAEEAQSGEMAFAIRRRRAAEIGRMNGLIIPGPGSKENPNTTVEEIVRKALEKASP